MKVRLTKKFIDWIDYIAKGTDIYTDIDDVLTGFALRVGKQSKRYTLHKWPLPSNPYNQTWKILIKHPEEKSQTISALAIYSLNPFKFQSDYNTFL